MAAIARRGLKELVGDALRGGPLLACLVEAELALGDVDAAAAATTSLSDLASVAESVSVSAQAGLSRARVAMARTRRITDGTSKTGWGMIVAPRNRQARIPALSPKAWKNGLTMS